MPRKKQGLRSYHHKSRNGCSNCKRRRVKCNMQAPACANCVRRNEVCEYQNLNSTPSTPTQIPSNAPNTPVNAEVPISSLAAVSSSFQSYAQNTAWEQQHLSPQIFPDPTQSPPSLRSFIYSLLNRSWFGPSEVPKWADALEEQCQKHEYLRHCIYAVAYLRRDLIDQPIDGTPVLAYQHQVAASRLFCQDSLVVNADNWIAVIGFHVFMLIFQFSTQSRCKDDEFNLTDTMAMLRSSMTIEEEVQKFFHQSQFWEDILKRTELLPQEIDHGLRRSLQSLATIISSSVENEENDDDEEELAEINRQAFWELREWVHECEARPRRWDQYSAWPARTTPEYIELLEDKDDIALLIFLHWAALTYRSPKPAVYNWARRAGFYAINNLKRDWSEILVWPLEVLSEPRPLLGTMTYRLGQTTSLAQHHSASAASTSAGGSNIRFGGETPRGHSSNLDPSLLSGAPGELDPAFFGGMAGSSNIDHSFMGGGPEDFHMAMPAHTTGSLDPALFASSGGDMDFGMHVLPSSSGAPDIDLIPSRTRFS